MWIHVGAYCKHTAHHCMKPGGPLMFLLQWCSMWPQSTSFIVTEGNTGAFIIPPPPPFYPKLLTQPKCKSASSVNVAPAHARNEHCHHTRAHARGYKKAELHPSLQSKPMAQRLARSYFFYHSVFFTSKAFNRMTSSVKAVPTRLTINSFSQRISFSLIPPPFFFTL